VAFAASLFLAVLLGTATAVTALEIARRHAESARGAAEKAKGEAESARNDAERARNREANARRAADAARVGEANAKEELRLRLVQNVDIPNAFHSIEQDDLFGSLAWFADALRLEQGDPLREEPHRVRLEAFLQACPKFTHMYFHDGAVKCAAFSPDGR